MKWSKWIRGGLLAATVVLGAACRNEKAVEALALDTAAGDPRSTGEVVAPAAAPPAAPGADIGRLEPLPLLGPVFPGTGSHTSACDMSGDLYGSCL